MGRRTRTAMYRDHHGIALAWVVVRGVQQPALDALAITHPVHAFQFAPLGMYRLVDMGHLLPLTDRPGPYLGRMRS